jgi:hypothetical protein
VLKLRNAMREYENDRWRIISTKVGSGFSPAACKEKAAEFAAAADLSAAGDLSMTSVADLSGVGVSRPPTAEDDDGSNNDFDKGQPESASTDAPPPPYA